MKPAVIYCRVSSRKQATEGHGLSSQEATCRKFAADRDLEVRAVFTDDYTGGGSFWNRPGICALLEYLDDQPGETAVIFDDIKRFARDTIFHLKLRQELANRDSFPLCPTFRFDDSPEGAFVETVIAATAELERKQNRRQVIRRMKARLEAGYWVFAPPLGYRFEMRDGNKVLVHDGATAKALKDGLESFARGDLATQTDFHRFLNEHGCKSRWSRGRTLSIQRVEHVLRNELYAGWCVSPKWGVRVKGRHTPLIRSSTHRKICARLDRPSQLQVRERRQFRPEFPLRGHALCSHCQRLMTACWSKGRKKKYPYYRCSRPACTSIRAEVMEAQFLERLSYGIPSSGAFKVLKLAIEQQHSSRKNSRHEARRKTRRRLEEIEDEVSRLVRAASRTERANVATRYEEQIDRLEHERGRLIQDLENKAAGAIEPVLDEAWKMIRNPVQYWRTGDLRQRVMLQDIAFDAPIRYDRDHAYRTASFSPVYAAIEASKGSSSRMVDLLSAGLNPAAEELRRWAEVLNMRNV